MEVKATHPAGVAGGGGDGVHALLSSQTGARTRGGGVMHHSLRHKVLRTANQTLEELQELTSSATRPGQLTKLSGCGHRAVVKWEISPHRMLPVSLGPYDSTIMYRPIAKISFSLADRQSIEHRGKLVHRLDRQKGVCILSTGMTKTT